MTNKTLRSFIKYATFGVIDTAGLSENEAELLLQLILTESVYSNEEEDVKDPIKVER